MKMKPYKISPASKTQSWKQPSVMSHRALISLPEQWRHPQPLSWPRPPRLLGPNGNSRTRKCSRRHLNCCFLLRKTETVFFPPPSPSEVSADGRVVAVVLEAWPACHVWHAHHASCWPPTPLGWSILCVTAGKEKRKKKTLRQTCGADNVAG